jgi:predicted ester cyclase
MTDLRAVATEVVTEVASSGDVDRLDAWVAADVVDHQPGQADVGLAEMKAAIVGLHQVVEEIGCTVEDTVVEDDRVVVRWDLRGKAREAHPELPAGAPVHFTGIALFRFADGRIVERWVNRNEEREDHQ